MRTLPKIKDFNDILKNHETDICSELRFNITSAKDDKDEKILVVATKN